MKKITVLLLTWHGGAGGVSKMIYEISMGLKYDADFKVTVGYAKSGGCFAELLKKEEVSTVIFNMRHGFDFVGAYNIYNYIRNNNFSVVHLHYVTPLLKIAVFLANKNLIITEHCGVASYKRKHGWFFYCLISKLTCFIGKSYTTVSLNSKDGLIKYGFYKYPNKILVIPNGVNLRHFTYPSSKNTTKTKKICIVKSLTEEHRVDHFILMARELLNFRNDVEFYIVGDGPKRKELIRIAKSLRVDTFISFLGECTDIPKVIHDVDVTVVTSVNETFCIVAVESMAMGKPVVAYSVGALPEVVHDPLTGRLVNPGDFRGLAKSINELLNDEESMEIMSKNCRKRVESHYDVKNIINNYKFLYRNF